MQPYQHNPHRKKILFLADQPGWAYDTCAHALRAVLADEFECSTVYLRDRPDLNSVPFDLLYVCFWGESYHQQFSIPANRIIKQIASHRWALEERWGKLAPSEMVQKYLWDAGTAVAVSQRLVEQLSPYRDIFLTPVGIDPSFYYLPELPRSGSQRLVFGWAGNAGDSCKGLHDILLPACGSDFTLRVADGSIAPQDMRSFYHSIDVLIVSSSAEGNPLPLLEAMACGCFVISTDVGIVPEVVRHRENGLIIDRRIACFRAALEWCELNASFVRNAGPTSAAEIASERSWASVARFSREAFRLAYAKEHMRSL